MSTPESLIENVQHLVSSPEIYLRLQQVLDDPNDTRQQAADVVAYAPSLSTRVLRISPRVTNPVSRQPICAAWL